MGRRPESERLQMTGFVEKIQHDVFMSSIAAAWGPDSPWEAGFFADTDTDSPPLKETERWLTTSASHLALVNDRTAIPLRTDESRAAESFDKAVEQSPTPVVLLSTGGFFPLHAGHLELMTTARRVAEDNGWWVVGGFLSPGHDQYLQQKWEGLAPMASTRLLLIEEQLSADRSLDWLRVDPWESLHCPVAVNYTEVVARMQAYLRVHVDPRIEVCYVCGGDNARFSLAFSVRGRCIVVNRPGYESQLDSWRADPRNQNDRVLWATSPGRRIASHDSELSLPKTDNNQRSLTICRVDTAAVRTLGLSESTWNSFQQALHALFAEYLSPAVVTLADPLHATIDQMGHKDSLVVSNNQFVQAAYNVGVSRKFELGGYRQDGHVARPGWPELSEQIQSLPHGSWTVLDDDVASGSTRTFLTQLLGHDRPVERFVPAIAPTTDDLVDSRDFLLGTDEGGLVIELPNGSVGRAPYVLPYVDSSARASIPSGKVLDFSRKVWDLNTALFSRTSLQLVDTPPPIQQTLKVAGFDAHHTLSEICRWHADTLRRIIGPDPKKS